MAVEVIDGHAAPAMMAALARAKRSDRPTLIRRKVVIGRFLPTKAGTASAHAGVLGDAEVAGAKAAMNWPYPPFVIPADVKAAWEAFGEAGQSAHAAWQERLAAAEPVRRQAFSAALAGGLPEGLPEIVTEANLNNSSVSVLRLVGAT